MILALLECANSLRDLAQSSAKEIDCLHVLEDDLLDLANSARHLPQSPPLGVSRGLAGRCGESL